MDINYAEVDLTQLVRLTAANFDGLAQERQIFFAIETPEAVPAQVDAQKVQRPHVHKVSTTTGYDEGAKCQEHPMEGDVLPSFMNQIGKGS